MTQQLQLTFPVAGAVDPSAGEQAKTAGMALAAAATEPTWADACQAAIRLMAARGIEFQAADLLAEGLVDEPDSPNKWGPQLAAAARHGVIEPAGWARSKRATTRSSALRTWRGTGTREAAA